jgi:hypothetical protein
MFSFLKLKKKKLPIRRLDEIKTICKILFIDDHSFKIVDTLTNHGWRNVRRIPDVTDLDQSEVSEAHILFVDIQGVGKKLRFEDEGLGLLKALRSRYPTKFLIVYSSEEAGKVNAFHETFNIVDFQLRKNSDHYQFQTIIERFAHESFNLEDCVQRINKLISKELGVGMTDQEITKLLSKSLNSKKPIDTTQVAKAFNVSVQTASNISSIAQIFLQLNT